MKRADIHSVHGMPALFVDGKRIPPILFFGNTEVAGHEDIIGEEIRLAAATGIHLHSVCGMADIVPRLESGGRRDFSNLFRAMDVAIDNDPEALILLRVNLCLYGARANDWERTHPGDRMVFAVAPAEGSGMVDEQGRWVENDSMVTIASDAWLSCAIDAFRELSAEVDAREPYATHLLGYHIAGAETGEWFHFQLRERGIDLSDTNAKAFRLWLTSRYGGSFDDEPLPADIPGNDRSLPADRTLLDRPKDQRYIDYADYASDLVADRILEFARAAREVTGGRRLLVFFYGYHFDLYDARTGHFRLGRILASPDIDALSSPICYTDRNEGGVGALMGPVDSVHLHGKLWFVENDLRTFLTVRDIPFRDWVPPLPDLSAIREVYRREAGTLMVHGCGCWYMDLFAKGWHSNPAIWEEVGRLRDLVSDWQAHAGPLAPDVAVVVDERSMSSVAHAEAAGMNLLYRFRLEFHRAGIRVGFYLLEDIEEGRVPSAKAVFLLDPFDLSDDRAERLAQQLERQEAGLVFMHGSGATSEQAVRRLTGMRLASTEAGPWPLSMDLEGFARELSESGAALQPPAMGDAGRGGGDPTASPVWSVAEGADSVLGRYAKGGAKGCVSFASNRSKGRLRLFFGGMAMSAALIREVCRRMDVPLFLETFDAFQAGNGVAVIHADRVDGTRTVHFPGTCDVLDVFTGNRSLAVDALDLEMPAKTTRILIFTSP